MAYLLYFKSSDLGQIK